MVFHHLILTLFFQAIVCSRNPRQSHTSSSPGLYAFAMNLDTLYIPGVLESQVDERRRLELLSGAFQAVQFMSTPVSTVLPVQNISMNLENEFDGVHEDGAIPDEPGSVNSGLFEQNTATLGERQPDSSSNFVPPLPKEPYPYESNTTTQLRPSPPKEPYPRDPSPPQSRYLDVQILPEVDNGRYWETYEVFYCRSRVAVFGHGLRDIRSVLDIMIEYGPISHAWKMTEYFYGRPNIFFLEYVHVEDAVEAVRQARVRFVGRVGVVPCRDHYNRRKNRVKITYTPGSDPIDKLLTYEFLEKEFGYVVDIFQDSAIGVAFITFNWIKDADEACHYFRHLSYTVTR